MRITVFGAAGRTGRHVLEQAEHRGHRLTAFTRRAGSIRVSGAVLDVVVGDGTDPAAVERAVAASDAVIAILGPASRKGPHEVATVAQTIVTAMEQSECGRLVITSAYPIVGDRPRILIGLLRRFFADSYADVAAMERVVSASDLDWTIIRLNRLLERPARGSLTLTTDLLARPAGMTRADVASTLIDLTQGDEHRRRAVNATSTPSTPLR